jgi:hypothetical protein
MEDIKDEQTEKNGRVVMNSSNIENFGKIKAEKDTE